MPYKTVQYKGFKIIQLASGEIKIMRGHVRMFRVYTISQVPGQLPFISTITDAKNFLQGYTTHFPTNWSGDPKYPHRKRFQI